MPQWDEDAWSAESFTLPRELSKSRREEHLASMARNTKEPEPPEGWNETDELYIAYFGEPKLRLHKALLMVPFCLWDIAQLKFGDWWKRVRTK